MTRGQEMFLPRAIDQKFIDLANELNIGIFILSKLQFPGAYSIKFLILSLRIRERK